MTSQRTRERLAAPPRSGWSPPRTTNGITRNISVQITETGRIPPMEIKLKKKAPEVVDPNVAIKDQLTQAAAMMNAKQYADARKIYEDLSAKHPEVKQFRPLIARTYYGEGNKAKAIEELRKAAAEDPENIEVRMLLGNTLMEEGQQDEARKILSAIDDTKVTDPAISNSASHEFFVSGGNGNITYNGSINSTAGVCLAVNSRTGGMTSFTGNITSSGTGIGVPIGSQSGA